MKIKYALTTKVVSQNGFIRDPDVNGEPATTLHPLLHEAEVGYDADFCVWRWTSNDQIPPADCEAKFQLHRLPLFKRETQDEVREIENRRFIEEYRRRQPAEPSAEERAEARAAFGPGAEVVDIFSGRRFTT